jgi:hypothetical protein
MSARIGTSDMGAGEPLSFDTAASEAARNLASRVARDLDCDGPARQDEADRCLVV